MSGFSDTGLGTVGTGRRARSRRVSFAVGLLQQ